MISPQDVEHIAKLARLKLSAEEKKKMEKELSRILDFVEQLNEVDTKDVKPLTGGTELKDAMRPDGQLSQDLLNESAQLLQAAPEKEGNWVKVKEVFGS